MKNLQEDCENLEIQGPFFRLNQIERGDPCSPVDLDI